MKRLCTICARGASKGVPGKNIRIVAEKPLIAHSIIQAKKSGLFEYVAVSSDCDDVLITAKEWGADYIIKRPDNLATDTAAKLPAIKHCIKEVEAQIGKCFNTLVDLDCTSPLRIIGDIKNCVSLLENSECDNVITGMPARRSPYFNLVEVDDNGIVSLSKKIKNGITRRQDAPACFDMNASIYAWKRNALLENNTIFLNKTKLYEMPEERSIDIDSPLDFEFVQFLMERKCN